MHRSRCAAKWATTNGVATNVCNFFLVAAVVSSVVVVVVFCWFAEAKRQNNM